MKIAMIGAGQQGTSQGLGYLKADDFAEVVFFDTNLDVRAGVLQKAVESGIDPKRVAFADTIEDAVADADVIGANVPGPEFAGVAKGVAQYAQHGAVFYDNGSGKTNTMKEIEEALGPEGREKINYFGAHFFVGRAGSGPQIADVNMYRGQTAAIMGPAGGAKDTVKELFGNLGVSNIRTDLSPQEHDKALGTFSHHTTFAVTALMLAFPRVEVDGQNLAIGRHLSSTRVAQHGDDGLLFWGPIANDNADAIVEAAQIFSSKLEIVKDVLKGQDKGALVSLFKQGHDYVSDIGPDRKFEGLEGDLHDLEALGRKGLELEASHVGMPIVFGAVSALMGQESEARGGQAFASIGNSSYRDTIRPMFDDPAKSADYIWERRDTMLKTIETFQSTYNNLIGAIESRDADKIAAFVEVSNAIREELNPAPKEEDLREEYIVGGPA